MSFYYNPQNWEFYEDENENQILKSIKNKNKEISFLDFNNYINRYRLFIIKEGKYGEYNEVTIDDYLNNGDFIYIFANKSDDQYNYYQTVIPTPIILKSDKITEEDKYEFKEIIKTLQFSKQQLVDLAYKTYIYPQGSYPRLFSNIEKFTNWAKLAYKTEYEKKKRYVHKSR